jgi:hypothetical protein
MQSGKFADISGVLACSNIREMRHNKEEIITIQQREQRKNKMMIIR